MGFICVKTVVDHIHGKKIPSKINIDVRVITRDNLSDPDIQKFAYTAKYVRISETKRN